MNTAILVNPNQTDITVAADDYLLQCDATLTPDSASKNRYTLLAMAAWCAARGETTLDQLTTRVSMQYLRHLATTPSPRTGRLRSRGTVRDAAVVIKTWLKWCHRQRYIDAERLYGYVIPKAKKPSVYMASSDQLRTVMQIIDDFWDIAKHPQIKYWPQGSHKFFRVRMRTIMAIQMSTGMRIGETLALRLSSYDPARKLIYVTNTKTGENRDVPVGPDLARALTDWLKVRPKSSPTDHLIVTETGTHLDRRTCTRQYQRYLAFARSQGVELPRLTMHSWRHVAINALAQQNPEHARKVAGHASLATTLRYLHTTTEDVRETHDKADPLAGIIVNTRSVKRQKPRARKLFTPA